MNNLQNLDLIKEIIISINNKGIITFINKEGCKILGYKKEEIIGKNWFKEFIPKENQEEVKNISRKILSGKEINFINPIKTRKGKRIISWHNKILKNDKGKIIGHISSGEDITELEEIKKSFNNLLNSSKDVIIKLNLKGEIININKAFNKITGYDAKKFIGKNVKSMNFLTKKSMLKVLKAITQLALLKKIPNYEIEIKTKKGEKKIGEISSSFIEENGKKVGFQAIIRDITDRKKIEERLTNSEEKFRKVFTKLPYIAFLLDTKGKFLMANEKAEELTGYRINDFKNKSFMKTGLLNAKELIKAGIEFSKNLQGKTTKKTIYHVKTKKGIRLIELAGIPLKKNNKVTMILDVGEDVTERESIKKELLKTNNMLQKVLDTIPVRVFWKDKKLNYLGCNKLFAKDAGLKSIKDIIGKNDFELVWKEQARKYRADDRKVINSGKPILNYEEKQTSSSGDIWLRTSKIPLTNIKGEITGVLGTYEDITKHKKIEEELRKNESKLKSIINNIKTGVILGDEQGNIIEFNPVAEKIYEIKRESALKLKVWDFIIKLSKKNSFKTQLFKTIYLIATKTGKLRDKSIEAKIRTKNKNKIVSFKLSAIKGKKGYLILQTIDDITKEKEKEKEILLLSKSFSGSPNSMVLVEYINKKPVIININNKFTDFYGYTKEEVIGKNPSILKSGLQSKQFYKEMWSKILDNKTGKFSKEIINKKKNGQLINVILSINTIFNEKGKAKYFVASHTDITQLKDSERRLQKYIDLSGLIITVLDDKGRVSSINKKGLEIFNYKKEQVIGKSWFNNFIPRNEKEMIRQEFNKVLMNGENYFESNIITSKGDKRLINWHSTILTNKDNKVIGILNTGEDITEKRKKEEEIKKLKEKQQMDETRKNFLLLITHELKQPLTPIMGYADLLKEDEINVDKLQYLDRIINGANEMYELITKIINLMRLETGQLLFHFNKIQLEKLINDSLRKKAALINLKNIYIKKKVTNTTFTGDYNLLRDLLVNLIDNAIKFSKPKQTITITGKTTSKEVIISVKDEGQGIKKEDLPKLFKTFSQTIEGRKKGGFGIGLSMCKMIAEKHGGSISVKSIEGKGSTFTVRIPKRIR